MTSRRLLPAALCISVLSTGAGGCTEPDRTGAAYYRWNYSEDTLQTVEDMRLPSRTAPSGFALFDIIGLRVAGSRIVLLSDHTGSVVVLDTAGSLSAVLHVTDSNHVRGHTLGRFGVVSDSIWIKRNDTGRIDFYDHGGSRLRTLHLLLALPGGAYDETTPYAYAGNDTYLARFRTRHDSSGSAQGGQDLYVRTNGSAEYFDTLALVTWTNSSVVAREEPFVVQSYDHRKIAVVTRMAPSSSASGRFRVRVINAMDGDDRWIEFEYVPRRVKDASLDSVGLGAPHLSGIHGARNRGRLPAFFPPVTRVVLGDNGLLFLTNEYDQERGKWAMVDLDAGGYSLLTVPPSVRLMHGTRDHLWGIDSAANGAASVVRLRIERADANGRK
jgi:hypothetical protein